MQRQAGSGAKSTVASDSFFRNNQHDSVIDSDSFDSVIFLKECSSSGELRLNIGNYTDNQLIVQILGLDPPVRCGSKRHLRAAATMKICDNLKQLTSNLVFHWTVIRNNSVISTGNDWVFVLQASEFEPGDVAQVQVQATYDDQSSDRNFTASNALTVTFEPQPLWIRLGATTRKQGFAEDLVLDGSASFDPNKKLQRLDHSWACSRLDAAAFTDLSRASACYLKLNTSKFQLFEEQFNAEQSVVKVPPNTFDARTYNFTNTVQSESFREKDTVTVTMVPGRVPIVDMLPSLVQKPSGDQALTVRANVFAAENATVTLRFVETQGYGNVTLPEALRNRTKVDVPASAIGYNGYCSNGSNGCTVMYVL